MGVVATVILGISTLIPAPASKQSLLGYYAPISTGNLLGGSLLAWKE